MFQRDWIKFIRDSYKLGLPSLQFLRCVLVILPTSISLISPNLTISSTKKVFLVSSPFWIHDSILYSDVYKVISILFVEFNDNENGEIC